MTPANGCNGHSSIAASQPNTPSASQAPDIEELHRVACKSKQSFYTDPSSGLVVFTAYHLSQRKCCGCGCRHCPYRPSLQVARTPKFLHGSVDDLPDDVDVVFWSGGKDSFCALRALQRDRNRGIVLLTTYNGDTGIVAHQEVHIADVQRQAKSLDLPLLTVPVAYGEYLSCVQKALEKLRNNGVDVVRLVFGDLHLEHVKSWRDSHIGSLGAQLHYPLWKADYKLLMQELEDARVPVRISAIDRNVKGMKHIKVGDRFNKNLVQRLPAHVDAFGENGEFHTLVHVWEK